MKRTTALFAAAVVAAAGAACSPSGQNANVATNAPAANANANSNAAPTPADFSPGTAQYIATHQPDYSADVTVQGGATKLTGKVAKLGENWRIESELPAPVGKTITFVRPGQKTIMLLVDKKQYVEYDEGADVNPIHRTLEGIAQPGVTFTKVGTELVDGHPTTKYRGTKEGETGEIVLFSAEDLKNLIIRIDGKKENVAFQAMWTGISLSVPPDTVQPPADLATAYKKVDLKEFQSLFSQGGEGDTTAGTTPPAATPAPARP
jgi:hypothetical protein